MEADEAYGEAATALQVNDLQVALRRPALDLIIACWLNQAQCQLQLRAFELLRSRACPTNRIRNITAEFSRAAQLKLQ